MSAKPVTTKKEIDTALLKLTEMPAGLSERSSNRHKYFSGANVAACEHSGIAPTQTSFFDNHILSIFKRFAPYPPAPDTDDAVEVMKHRLTTQSDLAPYGLRQHAVKPVLYIKRS